MNGQADVRAGPRPAGDAGRQTGGRAIFERDFDAAAAFRQPLPGLQTKVQDGLMNLRVVGVDLGTGGMDVRLQLNFGGDDGAQNLNAFFDDGLKADGLAFRRQALAEDAELVDEIARVVAGFKYILEGVTAGMFLRQVQGHEFGAAEDAGDEVVEFVGDAAGKLVEGVEFLGLQKLVLRVQPRVFALAAVGDIGEIALHAGLRAVADGAALFPDGAPLAARVADTVFHGEGMVFRDGGFHDFQHLLAVVGMNERGELKSFMIRLEPQQRVAAGAGEFDGAGAVGVAEIGRRAVRQRACRANGRWRAGNANQRGTPGRGRWV